MSKNGRISDRTLLASCLARLFEIPHAHQILMHEDHMISLAHRDHFPIPRAEGGSDHFSNVWARLIAEHKHKTATVDMPGIAKRKRLREATARHAVAMMDAKHEVEFVMDDSNPGVLRRPDPVRDPDLYRKPRKFKRKIAARVDPWPKGRKLQGRNNLRNNFQRRRS